MYERPTHAVVDERIQVSREQSSNWSMARSSSVPCVLKIVVASLQDLTDLLTATITAALRSCTGRTRSNEDGAVFVGSTEHVHLALRRYKRKRYKTIRESKRKAKVRRKAKLRRKARVKRQQL